MPQNYDCPLKIGTNRIVTGLLQLRKLRKTKTPFQYLALFSIKSLSGPFAKFCIRPILGWRILYEPKNIFGRNRRNKWKRQICSDMDSSGLQSPQARFPGPPLQMPMYTFTGSNMNGPEGGSTGSLISNMFCPGVLHPLYMGGHLPFPRSTVWLNAPMFLIEVRVGVKQIIWFYKEDATCSPSLCSLSALVHRY